LALCVIPLFPEFELDQLQYNLVRSHACGTGNHISKDSSRLVLLLKIISLSKGNSCIRTETLKFLIKLYNEDIIPVIPEMGSLGASGDLAPLAHLSLPLIGEGFVWKNDLIISTYEFLQSSYIKIPGLKGKRRFGFIERNSIFPISLGRCLQSKS
jgi:histidine ammonia-lyase